MNPLLDFDTYIPDVEAHIFNEKVFLYGSHDKKGGERFCMLDYEFFSSDVDDLEHLNILKVMVFHIAKTKMLFIE